MTHHMRWEKEPTPPSDEKSLESLALSSEPSSATRNGCVNLDSLLKSPSVRPHIRKSATPNPNPNPSRCQISLPS